jgi:hypothetical protein
MGDLATCWWVFLVMAGISAVLGFVYLVLLRWIAKPILYLSFVLIVALLIGGGFYAFFTNVQYLSGDHTKEVMKGMGVLLWILAALAVLILCCCWSRIQLGAAIVQAASDYVASSPSVFLVPFIFFFVSCAWIVFWVVSAVFVYSVGDAARS